MPRSTIEQLVTAKELLREVEHKLDPQLPIYRAICKFNKEHGEVAIDVPSERRVADLTKQRDGLDEELIQLSRTMKNMEEMYLKKLEDADLAVGELTVRQGKIDHERDRAIGKLEQVKATYKQQDLDFRAMRERKNGAIALLARVSASRACQQGSSLQIDIDSFLIPRTAGHPFPEEEFRVDNPPGSAIRVLKELGDEEQAGGMIDPALRPTGVYIRAEASRGGFVNCDVLDLDERSWRLFCLRKAMNVDIPFEEDKGLGYRSRYPKVKYED